jgi:biopolymer transport protein ExbD
MVQFDFEEELTGSSSGPDLTPMIDMVFILLVFFLLTSVTVLPIIDLELPPSDSEETAEEIELIITIDESGSVTVNREPVAMNKLSAHLKELSKTVTIKEIIVRADKKLPFGTVVEVMDIARGAGFDSLSFMIERE